MAQQKTSTEEVVEVYLRAGSVNEAARQLDVNRSTVQYHLKKAGIKKPVAAGLKSGLQTQTVPLPPEGTVKRYIFSCAQNNTWVNKEALLSLQTLAAHYNAEIHVSRFSYNLQGFQPAKPDATLNNSDAMWYDPAIEEYISDGRLQIAPNLVWCGEMNILPTAARPLSDLETYTGTKSGIFPHVKIAMESVANNKWEATKFNYTTGTLTKLNYIQKKAGLKAEFHHCFGGLLVEVDHLGRWFARQLNADSRGIIYDLDIKVDGHVLTTGNRVEAINWGDIHEQELSPAIKRLCWGENGLIDYLRPKYQFMHDLVSFTRRNHHDRKNPHRMFEIHMRGRDSVEGEMDDVAKFLVEDAARDFCETVVVDSNHDNALTKWLREADYREDPPNALFFLKCQSRKYQAIADEDSWFHLVEWVLQDKGVPKKVRFLREDEHFLICNDEIECGMHGHLGPNGARGTPWNLAKIGRKANTGHTHSAGIRDGLYTAGTCSVMDMGYNSGPGSWSHSHIITYPNGKRCINTMWHGAYRAV